MMNDAWTRALLGMLVVAFVGWASVVYRATGVVEEAIQRSDVRMERIATHLERLQHDHALHERQPWHDSAGIELAKIKERLSSNGAPGPEYP